MNKLQMYEQITVCLEQDNYKNAIANLKVSYNSGLTNYYLTSTL